MIVHIPGEGRSRVWARQQKKPGHLRVCTLTSGLQKKVGLDDLRALLNPQRAEISDKQGGTRPFGALKTNIKSFRLILKQIGRQWSE